MFKDCPVTIYQLEEEFFPLLEEYKNLKNKKVVLEIGETEGGTLWYWIQNAPPKTHIIVIDSNISQKKTDLWQDWADKKNVQLVIYDENSTDKQLIKDIHTYYPQIDFLFIDGSHIYKTVKSDFMNYSTLVRKGGIIALHDINNDNRPEYEVDKLWKEIKETGYNTKELITRRDKVGGMGIVYP